MESNKNEKSIEIFSKLTYRQRFAITEYGYLLTPEDAEVVGKMLGNFKEKDVLPFCQANGKKISGLQEIIPNIQSPIMGGDLVSSRTEAATKKRRAFLWIFTFLLGGFSIYFIVEKLVYQREDDPGWYWFLPLVLIALWLAMNSGSFPSVGFALFFLGLLFVILTGGPLLYPWGYPLISPVVTATIGGVLGSILGSQKDKNELIWEIGLALIGIILGGGIGYLNAVLHAG